MTERQWFAETYESCVAEADTALTNEQRIDALKAMLKGKVRVFLWFARECGIDFGTLCNVLILLFAI